MAEMNSRVNGSQCFPPPALCLRFPALQACTDDLPLVLQRPDNFPLVMGILQEINHEKVGFSSRVDLVSQKLHDQQIQTLPVRKIKLENLDVEDHHQQSCSSNPDLYQEWSLKGVEELLTDSEELQLRNDCYLQAYEAAEPLELASAQEEKPLFSLPSTDSQYTQKSSDEALLLLDEKLTPSAQLPNSVKEQVPCLGRILPIKEFSEAKPGVHALQAAVHQQQSQAFVENCLGLDQAQVVKREPERHACFSEAQIQDLTSVCTSTSSEVGHGKGTTDYIIPGQSEHRLTSITDAELNKNRKTTLVGHRSQARDVLLSGSPELKDKTAMNADCELKKNEKTVLLESDLRLNLETGVTKRWTVPSILRSTSAILALPVEFTEQERSQVPQSTFKSSAAQGLQVSTDFRGDGQCEAVSSEANCDFCELTLSLGSAQQQTPAYHKNMDCHSLPEEKPVVRTLFVQEEHHGLCQRSNPMQWKQPTKFDSHKDFSMLAYNEHLPCLPTDGCKSDMCNIDGDESRKVMGSISKSFDLYDSSPDEMPEKERVVKQSQAPCPTGNDMTDLCLDGNISKRTLQLMLQSSEDGASALENGEVEEVASEDDQLGEPNRKIAKESSNVQPSHVSPQSKLASESNEPHKKRMRGILPTEEKGDGAHKERETRCHRSDGKSWRCARECINGAYYCQYHLRARRIGYNRRKNRDTYMDQLVSGSKKSSWSGKKSRRLLSTSNLNIKQ